jgi:hypothetical protein
MGLATTNFPKVNSLLLWLWWGKASAQFTAFIRRTLSARHWSLSPHLSPWGNWEIAHSQCAWWALFFSGWTSYMGMCPRRPILTTLLRLRQVDKSAVLRVEFTSLFSCHHAICPPKSHYH